MINEINTSNIETAVLGAMVLCASDEQVSEAYGMLKPQYFWEPLNNRLFKALQQMRSEGLPIDLLTVTQYLRSVGESKNGLNAYYLTSLSEKVANAANTVYHAQQLYQEYCRRLMISTFEKTTAALKLGMGVPEQITQIEDLLTSMVEGMQTRKGREMGEIAEELIERLQNILDGVSPGLITGLSELDSVTGGFQDTDLTILAARTSMGKSDFGLAISSRVAKMNDCKVGFIAMEMSDIKCLARLVSMESDYNKNHLAGRPEVPQEAGKVSPRLIKSIINTSKSGVVIKDLGTTSLDSLISTCKKLVREGCKMIVIDYLGLVELPKGMNEVEGYGEIARRIKMAVATDLSIPVILIHQLNRTVEDDPGKIPTMRRLRGSGKIEEHANNIYFLYRPEVYGYETDEEGNSTLGLCELIIAKQREGELGSIKLRYSPSKGTFSNWVTPFGVIPQKSAPF